MYDAIIIGGGIAGLMLGSELAKEHKILIIEKGKIGKTTKAWTTEKKILKKAGLDQFIIAAFSKNYIKSYNSKKNNINADLATVNEEKILLYLKSKILSPSKILENCEFLSFNKRTLTVTTSLGKERCRLIIDCSGINSRLAKKYQIYKRRYYYPTYGEILKVDRLIEPSLLEILYSHDPIVFFEAFPYTNKSIVAYTFQYIQRNINPMKLEKLHKKNSEAPNHSRAVGHLESCQF